MNELEDVLGTTGSIIRQWRKQRALSQAQLAAEVDISTRHLSFIECSKSRPSMAVLEKVIQALRIPKMQANQLMMVTGYSGLKQPVGKQSAKNKKERGPDWLLDFMLDRFSPYTAFVHDEYMNFIDGNKSFETVMKSFPFTPYLFDGKLNALLTVAHPLGLRPYIKNWQSIFQQMFWRFQNKAKANPEDKKYKRIIEELEKIPDIPELLNSKIPEDVLLGIGEIKLNFEGQVLRFTRVTSDFQGPLTKGYSRHYHMIAFLPSNQETAEYAKYRLASIFEDTGRLREIAQLIKASNRSNSEN